MIHNREIAQMLSEVADILEIKGKNQFRIRSYRDASRVISGMPESLSGMVERKERVDKLPGIGESMAGKIKEIVREGRLRQLEELKEEVPPTLLEIMELEQMGPGRTRSLYQKLGVCSVEDLKEAAQEGRIENVEGFGKKTAEKILSEIENHEKDGGHGRFRLGEVDELTGNLLDYLSKELENITVAGSYRRRVETVGDIDILATCRDPGKGMSHFTGFGEVDRVLSRGEKKSSVVLHSGLQADLRIVEKKAYGAALLYFTGSKAHSIALRKIGQEKDLKVNEYGIFRGKKKLASKTEKEMYKALDLRYIEPELREDRGEFEASRQNELPRLITEKDIRGDLQSHSKASDGRYSIREMADAAREQGYEYIAITDHSKRVTMANGLDEKRIRQQMEEIDRLNEQWKGFRILKSAEVDILKDGSLDLPDSLLKELDITICAYHYHLKLSAKEQTRRIMKAMENPRFNILAHPTGRMIGKRKESELDLEKIMKHALDQGCFLEINASPDRLDLRDDHIRTARELGLKLAISTDAHTVEQLRNMKYGVAQARRGWLEKGDVINTRSWKKLKALIKRD